MRILAHRGASGYAPENTFAAFELGKRMGADAIETDVRMTRDGVLVLIHDEKVDRTTTGTGDVVTLSYAKIAGLDAGVKFDAKFAGERVPRADEFLKKFATVIPICLEIKTAAVVEPLIGLLESQGLTRNGALEFTSFEWEIVETFHRRVPGVRVGHLTREFNSALIEQTRKLGLMKICPPAKDVTRELVTEAHRAGLKVRTWGAKTREVLQHIIECGVDGTTLNHPDWICRENGKVRVVPEETVARGKRAGEEM